MNPEKSIFYRKYCIPGHIWPFAGERRQTLRREIHTFRTCRKIPLPSHHVQRDRRAACRIVSFFAADASWLAVVRMALPATKTLVKIQR